MRLHGGCATDVGNVREVNQDAIFFRSMEKAGQYFALGAVCDGIGSLAYSELAAERVIDAIAEWFDQVATWLDIERIEPDILFSHLKDAAEIWNGLVRELSAVGRFMTGTTMSVLMMIRTRYYIVHVGDSRICLYRDILQKLTEDETVVRMKDGRKRYVLSNYMGKKDALEFMVTEGTVMEGDMFLYGSDGLYHFLRQEDIREIYGLSLLEADLHAVCVRLIEIVKARGERDNISAGIIMTGKDREKQTLREVLRRIRCRSTKGR